MVSFVKILLTGATGFVGGRLASHFARSDAISLVCAVRRAGTSVCGEEFVIGELNATTEWTEALIGQDVVIHAAARVHIMQDETEDPLGEYRKINVRGTLNLARQAARAGVRRFIFISSIKVNGEHSPRGFPFTADAAPAPEDAYGISKLEAEEALSAVATETGMEVVIIRPPLVYGPGVKGNFATLIELLEKGVPLPLGAIHNKRSLVALDNLVDLIVTCIDHPKAGNQVFLAGDGEDVSTTELLRGIGNAIGRPARLIPVPAAVLMFGAGLLGKKAVAQRVLGSLQVDISKTRRMLGWEPPLSLEEGLRRCFDSERSC
ncbi:UDP-glucose 4-epimerase family protein [Marinobacter nauticus]|jgi:nucleoside-diphosphate-sugar epimerase|uniref:UDP-glucose 4-epimerase family protein n=1 Tax=Marinobacter nauticus TaxID=2743 RepID=UPI001CD60EA1|nr:SDR family oxidoreductase [Marinobacter nauticus]MCA0912798.1 SDR family oxidoreductase [Marinobacter nauticus]|tara:strand:- start:1086 stop:2045 length:960 start_codon:yes stop_codon:yes gene_type:complete